jgi:hypothetical protein
MESVSSESVPPAPCMLQIESARKYQTIYQQNAPFAHVVNLLAKSLIANLARSSSRRNTFQSQHQRISGRSAYFLSLASTSIWPRCEDSNRNMRRRDHLYIQPMSFLRLSARDLILALFVARNLCHRAATSTPTSASRSGIQFLSRLLSWVFVVGGAIIPSPPSSGGFVAAYLDEGAIRPIATLGLDGMVTNVAFVVVSYFRFKVRRDLCRSLVVGLAFCASFGGYGRVCGFYRRYGRNRGRMRYSRGKMVL